MNKNNHDKNHFNSQNPQINTEPNHQSNIQPLQKSNLTRSRSQSPINGDMQMLEQLQQQQEELIQQNQQLRQQLQQNSFYDRIELIQNRISQLQPLRDKLQQEKTKLLSNIKQVDDQLNERAAYTGYEEQITRLEAEAKRLKDKLKEIKNDEQKNEKKQRRQNKFLVMLEEDYRIVCEEHGISASINLTRAQDIDHIEIKQPPIVKKQKDPKYPEVNTNLQVEPTEENIEKLQNSINEIRKSFLAEEKHYRRQIAQLRQQLQEKEVELAQKLLQVRDKEHEVHVIQLKISEMMRNLISEREESPESKDFRDEVTSIKSKSRKETHGLKLVDDHLFSFDDAQKLMIQRLTVVEVWFDKRIYGLRMTYEEVVTQYGRTDLESHRKSLSLDKNEYIQHIRIGLGSCVEYLLLKTNRENSLETGKFSLKLKVTDFLINKNESIHSFHGSFSSQGLIALGVTLHKKHLGSGSVNISQVKSRIDNRYVPNPFYQL